MTATQKWIEDVKKGGLDIDEYRYDHDSKSDKCNSTLP